MTRRTLSLLFGLAALAAPAAADEVSQATRDVVEAQHEGPFDEALERKVAHWGALPAPSAELEYATAYLCGQALGPKAIEPVGKALREPERRADALRILRANLGVTPAQMNDVVLARSWKGLRRLHKVAMSRQPLRRGALSWAFHRRTGTDASPWGELTEPGRYLTAGKLLELGTGAVLLHEKSRYALPLSRLEEALFTIRLRLLVYAEPQQVRIHLAAAGFDHPDRASAEGDPFGLPLVLERSEWVFEGEERAVDDKGLQKHRPVERRPLRPGWNEVLIRCQRPIGPKHARDVEVRANGELMLGEVDYFGKLWHLEVETAADSPVVLALELTPEQ